MSEAPLFSAPLCFEGARPGSRVLSHTAVYPLLYTKDGGVPPGLREARSCGLYSRTSPSNIGPPEGILLRSLSTVALKPPGDCIVLYSRHPVRPEVWEGAKAPMAPMGRTQARTSPSLDGTWSHWSLCSYPYQGHRELPRESPAKSTEAAPRPEPSSALQRMDRTCIRVEVNVAATYPVPGVTSLNAQSPGLCGREYMVAMLVSNTGATRSQGHAPP